MTIVTGALSRSRCGVAVCGDDTTSKRPVVRKSSSSTRTAAGRLFGHAHEEAAARIREQCRVADLDGGAIHSGPRLVNDVPWTMYRFELDLDGAPGAAQYVASVKERVGGSHVVHAAVWRDEARSVDPIAADRHTDIEGNRLHERLCRSIRRVHDLIVDAERRETGRPRPAEGDCVSIAGVRQDLQQRQLRVMNSPNAEDRCRRAGGDGPPHPKQVDLGLHPSRHVTRGAEVRAHTSSSRRPRVEDTSCHVRSAKSGGTKDLVQRRAIWNARKCRVLTEVLSPDTEGESSRRSDVSSTLSRSASLCAGVGTPVRRNRSPMLT